MLDRAIAQRRDIVEAIGRQAVLADEAPVETILRFIAAHLDSLAADPGFLLLVDRESLSRRPRVYESEAQLQSLRATIEAVAAQLDRGGYDHIDPRQLMISSLGLCEWAFTHRPLVAGLGFDPTDPAFISERKRHIIALVRAALAHGQ